MFRFAPYVLKTLRGHPTRTLLTISGAAVALFVFCFVGAVQEGLDRLTAHSAADRQLIVFQANRFCPATSRIPEDYSRAIAEMPGVQRVIPIKVFTNNCRASLDVVVFHGVPPEMLPAARDLKLLTGNWPDFQQRQNAALVGRAVAQRRGLKAGEPFTIGGVNVQVVGTFTADMPAEENYIYTHLDFLQGAVGRAAIGTVTQFEVQLADGANAEQVASDIDAKYRSGPIETDTRTKGVFQANTVADLAELIGFARYLGFACVGLVLAVVSTTMVMAVQDRIREHAVLQTIGVSPPKIFGLIVSESLLVSAQGGMLGVTAALGLLAWGQLAVATEGVSIAFTPSATLAVTGLVVSLCVGLLAGLVPGWQAARAEIVTALRQA